MRIASESRTAAELAETLGPLVQRSAIATAAARSQVLIQSDLDKSNIDIGLARAVLASLVDSTGGDADALVSLRTAAWSAETNERREFSAQVSLAARIVAAKAIIQALYRNNTAITELVSEWRVIQDRIATASAAAAATQAAAVAAAAATEAAAVPATAVAHSAARAPTYVAHAGPATFTIFVRASVNAGYPDSSTPGGLYNGQDQINRGGQVAINWPRWGTFISAHNSNDPSALKMKIGDIVQLSGAISGTFRVIGTAVIHKGDGPDQALQLPTRLFMQTCFFGSADMRLVGLAAA